VGGGDWDVMVQWRALLWEETKVAPGGVKPIGGALGAEESVRVGKELIHMIVKERTE